MAERVVVTGGAGFLGSHLVRALRARGADVLSLDRRESATTDFCVDICSREARAEIASFRPSRVFHLAGAALIPYCNDHPREALDANVVGTASLLQALRRVDLEAVVLASSAAVYGYGERLSEQESPRPGDVYGISKLLAESLVRLFDEERPDVVCRIARLFSPYGPGDSPSRLLPRVLDAHRQAVPLRLGNLWPRRDFVHVDDAVEALLRIAAGADTLQVVNIGTGVGTSVRELVELVSDLTRTSLPLESDPGGARSDDGHRVSDNSRLVETFGWRARYTLRAGVESLLAQEGTSGGSG